MARGPGLTSGLESGPPSWKRDEDAGGGPQRRTSPLRPPAAAEVATSAPREPAGAEGRGGVTQAGLPWFSRLGQALDGADLSAARAYVAALGLGPGVRIAVVTQRLDAEALIRSPDWDPRWWEIESGERERLQALAQDGLGRVAVLEHLSALTAAHNDALQSAAETHLDADPALSRAGAGAAALALHEQALARLAGAGRDHLFMRKCRLFARGRWPLGVVRQTFHLF